MMSIDFEKKLNLVSSLKTDKNKFAIEILENQELYTELIQHCFQISNKNTVKAIWILELVCYEKLEWLKDYLDIFCANIKNLTDQSGIRPASKICMLLAIAHFKNKDIQLTNKQMQQITEACFDWLIKDTKVASKCYSIRALHQLGKQYEWIHPELKFILDKDYNSHSCAYKAVAREILKKIK
ncbi:MAG TPA: hypothetical protein VN182_02845 [Flavobacterium sp.]|nr:hypothetical protein [Flavobacterium sp.]